MSTIELKTEFHQLIDGINDRNKLKNIYKMVREYLFKNNSIDWNDIPTNLKQELEEGIKQANNGKLVSYSKVKKEMKRRFNI